MVNFELIDDYLANRLQEQERIAFELQMEGDPSLQEEVAFQKTVVEGVRKARAAELKAMLRDVPVNGSSWSGGQIAAGIVVAGLVATAIYFYASEDPQPSAPDQMNQEVITTPDKTIDENSASPDVDIKENKPAEKDPDKVKVEINKENAVTRPVTKPDIQVVDPSIELSESKPTDVISPSRHSEISVSKMEVITGLSDKKHNFHYQFLQGKLMLYGPFDKSLYEILEINGDGHAVFLFYKENYYMLDEKQEQITRLEPIRDAELLKKLKEYRSR